MKQFDRLPSIQTTLSTAGAPVDLTTATSVTFIMKPITGGAIKVNAAATIVSLTGGIVRYDWLATDTNTAGIFNAEWQVNWPSSKEQTFPTQGYHVVEIVPDLNGS